jgi:hypothetical protein
VCRFWKFVRCTAGPRGLEVEVAEVEASEASFARKAEGLTALDVERDRLLDELAGAGQTTTREVGPEYLGLLFQLKGDYGLRKEQTPDGGYRWVPDPEAEGYWLDHLLDVPACRKYIRESRLGALHRKRG